MGWFSHVIVLLCVVGTQLTKAYPKPSRQPGIGLVQNNPLLDQNTGENFAYVFAQSLEKCGSFSHEEAQDYKQIIQILTKAFGSYPNLQKAPPGVLKATEAGIAAAIAERTAADIGQGELFTKMKCVIHSLREAFIVTTGVTNPYFISEVERLIEIFYITTGFPYSSIEPQPPQPPQVQIPVVPQSQTQ